MQGLLLALSFLTTLPVRIKTAPQPGDMGRAATWFPVIGLVLGGILFLCKLVFDSIFPGTLSATLVIAVWAALTGALHLDGLADCCDGMLHASSPARRLEIMKDPRLGTFGGAGLVIFLLLKTSAVLALPPYGAGLILAPVFGRWLILLAARQPMARPGGMGADFAAGLQDRTIFLGALIPVILVIFIGWQAALAAAAVHIIALGLFKTARSRLGGLTGDVFGLTIELSELTTLLIFAGGSPWALN